MINKEINGFKIIKLIGEGKFSHVYQGIGKNKEIVAIKKLKIFDEMNKKDREKCLKEVELMKQMKHENIIKFIDSIIYQNDLFIITELVERGDLKRLLKNAKENNFNFNELRIWEFIIQLVSAIKHMNEHRTMHRDLKPANILVDKNGNWKIADLGLGRVFGTQTLQSFTKVGTPLYMSPELIKGEGYDMNSDVWSLGCIIYELCEMESPFRKKNEKITLDELFNRITNGSIIIS